MKRFVKTIILVGILTLIYGYIVYDLIGKTDYNETEKTTQETLEKRDKVLGTQRVTETIIAGQENTEEINTKPISPKIYFGAARNERLKNGTPFQEGIQTFIAVAEIEANALYLNDEWNITDEFAENTGENTRIIFAYQGQKMSMAASGDGPITVQVLRDGKLLTGDARGSDVRENGTLVVEENRLYHLVDDEEYGLHIIELLITRPGMKAFTLTFG